MSTFNLFFIIKSWCFYIQMCLHVVGVLGFTVDYTRCLILFGFVWFFQVSLLQRSTCLCLVNSTSHLYCLSTHFTGLCNVTVSTHFTGLFNVTVSTHFTGLCNVTVSTHFTGLCNVTVSTHFTGLFNVTASQPISQVCVMLLSQPIS